MKAVLLLSIFSFVPGLAFGETPPYPRIPTQQSMLNYIDSYCTPLRLAMYSNIGIEKIRKENQYMACLSYAETVFHNGKLVSNLDRFKDSYYQNFNRRMANTEHEFKERALIQKRDELVNAEREFKEKALARKREETAKVEREIKEKALARKRAEAANAGRESVGKTSAPQKMEMAKADRELIEKTSAPQQEKSSKPAVAGKYGVIMVGEGADDPTYGRKFWFGYHVDDTREKATQTLYIQCRRTPVSPEGPNDCKVEHVWTEGCRYFAMADYNRAYGWATTSRDAQAECSTKYKKPCEKVFEEPVCVN